MEKHLEFHPQEFSGLNYQIFKLWNPSNTCYINCIIQLLWVMEPSRAVLTSMNPEQCSDLLLEIYKVMMEAVAIEKNTVPILDVEGI